MCPFYMFFFVSFANLILNVASLACRKKRSNSPVGQLNEELQFFFGQKKNHDKMTHYDVVLNSNSNTT